jgi:hypothetical protein
VRIRLVFFAFISTAITAVSAFAQTASGRVIDPSGRPLPRAYVPHESHQANRRRATESSPIPMGRFSLATATDNLHDRGNADRIRNHNHPVQRPATRGETATAPVSEHVVVSATRTEMPAGEVGNSVSVFRLVSISSAPVSDRCRRPARGAWSRRLNERVHTAA